MAAATARTEKGKLAPLLLPEATISPGDLRGSAAPRRELLAAQSGVRSRALRLPLAEADKLDLKSVGRPGGRANGGGGDDGGSGASGDTSSGLRGGAALSRADKFKRNRLRSLLEARCRRNLTLALCRWWVVALVVPERPPTPVAAAGVSPASAEAAAAAAAAAAAVAALAVAAAAATAPTADGGDTAVAATSTAVTDDPGVDMAVSSDSGSEVSAGGTITNTSTMAEKTQQAVPH